MHELPPRRPAASMSHRTPRPALRWWPAWAASAALLSACASTPPPKTDLALAEAAVVNATNAGALQWAPAEMRTAQDKLARAQSALAAQDNSRALTLAHEASADAQLAATAARAAKAQRAADEVQAANRVVREEMTRKQATPPARMP